MAVHAIQLRWRGRCARCRTPLAAGQLARFDDVTHQIACLDCRANELPLTDPARVKAMIAEARAALARARQAS
jgi:hypothetical protein